MAFDEGSTVDYSKVDQIYDPDDPRIVTKQYQSSVFHNPGSGSEEWMP